MLGLSALADEAGLPGTDTWGGSLFLGLLGIGFAAVYLRGHERWWAIIPAAALAALAVLAVLVALEVTALLSVFNYLWPLALIAGGGFLLWRALGRRRTPSSSEEHGSR